MLNEITGLPGYSPDGFFLLHGEAVIQPFNVVPDRALTASPLGSETNLAYPFSLYRERILKVNK